MVWQFLSGAYRSGEYGGRTSALDDTERASLLRTLTHVAAAFASAPQGWVDRMSRESLQSVIGGPEAAGKVLRQLADKAGILVPTGDPAHAEQDYMFLHRTIAEYLVARFLRDLPPDQRMAEVEKHQWFDPDWAEVIPLLAGLLAARREQGPDAQALIAHFLTQRRDPLYYAFRTALRILAEYPALADTLTSAQNRAIHDRIARLFRSNASYLLLTRVLGSGGTLTTPCGRP